MLVASCGAEASHSRTRLFLAQNVRVDLPGGETRVKSGFGTRVVDIQMQGAA